MPTASNARRLQSLNHYDRHRVTCTCDDKRTAAMLSGQTWNIINNNEDHEVYLRHARNGDHYISDTGGVSSHWFEKKKRIDLDGDGIIDCVDSSNVEETMRCPPSAGRESAYLRQRAHKQMCQAAAPRDFPQYSSIRGSQAPATPPRDGMFGRKLEEQHRLRDTHALPTPRVVAREDWTPRRGEPRPQARPPRTPELFQSRHQVRAEPQQPLSARRSSLPPPAPQRHGTAAMTARPARERSNHSASRIEQTAGRELTSWPFEQHDRMRRDDPYHAKPAQQSGSSCVKYDIISNERHNFWY